MFLVAIALTLGAGRAFALSPDFEAMLSYDTAREPKSVAIGDLNGDGRPDVAVACEADRVISILLGRADGTFGPRSDQPAGNRPSSIAIGDLDGDGILDLAETNVGVLDTRSSDTSSTVGVMIGRGDGSFARPVEYPTGQTPKSVAIGDVNGDGWNDMVVANYAWDGSAPSTVSVLLGRGDGTFEQRRDFRAGNHLNFVAMADVDGDGDLDLAIADELVIHTPTSIYDGRIWVLLGNGDGTFAAGVDYITGNSPRSIAIGDLNADQHLDLVVPTGATLFVFWGEGRGIFSTGQTLAAFPWLAPNAVALGDLNHDGLADLAVTSGDPINFTSRGFASVALGNGDGTFRNWENFSAPGSGSVDIIEDLDRDSAADLILRTTSGVSVIRGGGDGTFIASKDYLNAAAGNIDPSLVLSGPVAVSDVNGDARLDLVANGIYSQAFPLTYARVVLLGRADGGFSPPLTSPLLGGLGSVADLNDDGRVDVAGLYVWDFNRDYAISPADTLLVTLGQGDGTFQSRLAFPTGSRPISSAVGDLNQDGFPDLAVIHGQLFGIQSGGFTVSLGNGDGTLQSPTRLSAGQRPSSIVIVDMNQDDRLDVVLADEVLDCVFVLLGQGNGGFAIPFSYPTGHSPSAIAFGDLNRDGVVDLVAANGASATASVLLGHGDGTFAPTVDYSTLRSPRNAAIGDVDGDGDLDVAVSCQGGIAFLLGNGDGTFTPTEYGFGHASGGSLVLADFDGDGAIDLLQNEPLSLLRNTRSSEGVIVSPAVWSFHPARGKPGTKLIIHGRHLTGATAVRIGDCAVARYRLLADSLLEAVIDTLNETGVVSVTTPRGTDASATEFVVTRDSPPPAPIVSSFNLALGPVPVSDALQIVLALPTAGMVRLEAFEVGGRRVLKESVLFSHPGIQRYEWQAFRRLKPAMYFVRVQAGTDSRSGRAVVVR